MCVSLVYRTGPANELQRRQWCGLQRLSPTPILFHLPRESCDESRDSAAAATQVVEHCITGGPNHSISRSSAYGIDGYVCRRVSTERFDFGHILQHLPLQRLRGWCTNQGHSSRCKRNGPQYVYLFWAIASLILIRSATSFYPEDKN